MGLLNSDWLVEVMLVLMLQVVLGNWFIGDISATEAWIMISVSFMAAYGLRSAQLHVWKKIEERSRRLP